MLNNIEIKKFPSKERMAQISEKWKILPQEQKDWWDLFTLKLLKTKNPEARVESWIVRYADKLSSCMDI